ncbi:HYR domain-containing protein [Sphingobacteriales bacterium UPWRP_1]|nr:hypothetical protein BVG80_10725 [Sphingobacteriales bacterium TSM_CSM]PSJ72671.1 HYR domain-containing protein [Sphingobacteriales bacterium UPWRP_1]
MSFEATATDNCGVSSIVYRVGTTVITFPYDFGVGSTTVTATATDVNGLASSCNFTVVVVDNQQPAITCPTPAASYNTDLGECNATLSFAATATDNCGVSGIVYRVGTTVITFPYDFPVGSTAVTATATDVNGLASSCSFTVVVVDNQQPAITCPTPAASYNTDLDECNATLSFAATATDNCGISGYSYAVGGNSITFPYDFPVGSTAVTATATDVNGLASSCNFTVVVVDNQQPAITCPTPAASYNTDLDECNATLSFEATATDNCGIVGIVYRVGTTVITFPYDFGVGSTAVTATATDVNGLASSCDFTVVVVDNQQPTITCPTPATSYNTDLGECNATLSFAATATDNCGVSGIVYRVGTTVITFPYDFPVGSTIVTATATDVNGLASSCNFTVVVVDNQQPAITCPTPAASYNTDLGECNAILSFAATATDNCGASGIVYRVGTTVITFPYDFGVGSTIVTATATDVNGLASSCSFTVVVVDNQQPAITCPASPVTAENDLGLCGASVSYSASATDNCGTVSVTYSINPGSFFIVGTTPVVATATDAWGNTSQCTFNVVVQDTEAPALVCPENQTRGTQSPLCGYVADAPEFNPVSGGDNCVIVITSYELTGATTDSGLLPLNGVEFQKGVTTVEWTAQDLSGNSTVCSFTVTVLDDDNPQVNCVGDQIRAIDVNACTYTTVGNEFDWTDSYDNCGVIVSANYTLEGATLGSGANTIAGIVFEKGVTTVTWTVTDDSGNTGACSFTVTVKDYTLPVVTCVNTQERVALPGTCLYTTIGNEFDPSGTTDNCGVESVVYNLFGVTTGTGYNTLDGLNFNVGQTVVVWIASDASNNTNTCTFNVVVEDKEPPALTCPADILQPADTGTCATVVTYAATADDLCSGTIVDIFPASGSSFSVGTHSVQVTATDDYGNASVCNFNVTVVDTEPPVVSCPPNITTNTLPNLCWSIVEFEAAATDNCGSVTTSATPASGSVFSAGVTTVTVTATDAAGLESAPCSFTITVTDLVPPLIYCPDNIAQPAEAGGCSATVTVPLPLVSDNCTIAAVTNDYTGTANASGVYYAGGTLVTYTATDNGGNSAECTFLVTITDVTGAGAAIACPANIEQPALEGFCNTPIYWEEPEPVDLCGGSIIALIPSNAPGSTFDVGVTTVVYTAIDEANNTATCSFTVTVTDMQAPTIVCPDNITQVAAEGACTAEITVPFISAFDNCLVTNLTNDYTGYADASGLYNIGTTLVTATAFDAAGHQTSCSFEVSVTADPVISCPTNFNYVLPVGTCKMNVFGLSPVVSDACGTGNVVTYSTTGASSLSGTVDISGREFVAGTTEVVYTLSDTDGNTLDFCSFNVEITDTELPLITCPKSISISSAIPVAVFYETPVATDNCGISSVTLISGLSAGSFFPIGTNTVIYAATDVSGNSSSCSFTVTIQPVIVPMQFISSTVQSNSVVYPGPYDGAISVVVTGGNPCAGGTYNYVWAGPISWTGASTATGSSITGIPNGWYTVTITDCGPDGVVASGDEQTLINWYYVPFKARGRGKTELEKLGTLEVVPNPFEYHTTVMFAAERSCEAEVSITDMSGLEVAKLYKGFVEAGQSYVWPVDATRLPEGLYICRVLAADGMQLTEKLLLLEGQR